MGEARHNAGLPLPGHPISPPCSPWHCLEPPPLTMLVAQAMLEPCLDCRGGEEVSTLCKALLVVFRSLHVKQGTNSLGPKPSWASPEIPLQIRVGLFATAPTYQQVRDHSLPQMHLLFAAGTIFLFSPLSLASLPLEMCLPTFQGQDLPSGVSSLSGHLPTGPHPS
jgi:hypothetical protein